MKEIQCNLDLVTHIRPVASVGAGRALAPPFFGQTVNPISTRGADYPHHSNPSPPGFSDLATGLHMVVQKSVTKLYGVTK